jgi:hypothetical protein
MFADHSPAWKMKAKPCLDVCERGMNRSPDTNHEPWENQLCFWWFLGLHLLVRTVPLNWVSHAETWIVAKSMWVSSFLPQMDTNWGDYCMYQYVTISKNMQQLVSGWWFGTFFIFPYWYSNHNWLSYFSEGLKLRNHQPATVSQECYHFSEYSFWEPSLQGFSENWVPANLIKFRRRSDFQIFCWP